MSAPVVIEGELTVYAAHALKERLLIALSLSDDLTIDLSGISEVDGAGLQLLMATKREVHQRGGALKLNAPPPQLIEAMELTALWHDFADCINQTQEHVA